MKLDTALQAFPQATFGGQGGLVAEVLGLIDCLEATEGAVSTDDRMQRDAARRALAAAIAAEQRLAGLGDRVLKLEALVQTDPLTGLLNRRGFEEELGRTLALAKRHGETGVLVYLDLDRFKAINDIHGHAAGDAVLRRVGHTLAGAVRRADAVARLGGDEFAIVLKRAEHEGGGRRARSIERLVNSIVVVHEGHTIAVHGSVGSHPFGPDDEAETVLARADAEMYRRKRDRVRSLKRMRAACA